jgi:outer membrane usher protein
MRARKLLGGLIARGTYHIVAILLLGVLAPALAADDPRETVLEISVNTPTGGESILCLRGDGNELWLVPEDFSRLHLKLPPGTPLVVAGHAYYRLAAIEGAKLEIADSRQHATLTVPASAFEATRLHGPERGQGTLSRAEPGAFLNYQVSGQRVSGTASGGALAELGVFAGPGVLTNSMVGRTADGVSAGIRLDTTVTHDLIGRLETLTLGDSISNPGSWGNAVRFAGVHWGTNFGMRPDLITTPLLTAGGTAVVPSTVDVFVNGQHVSSQTVPAGPFVIDRLPAITGSGDLRLIVRDALGQEQTITQPFYSGTSLLAAGLSDYAIDVGVARENYALESFDYGGALVSANYRRGLTDSLTLEGHGEAQLHDAHAVGLDLGARAGQWAIASLTLAQGGNALESGWLTGFGLEHRGRVLTLVLNQSYAVDGFHQVGDSSLGTTPFRERTLAQAGVNLRSSGSVSLAWVRQTYRAAPAQQIASLTYNLRVEHLGWLSLVATRTTGPVATTSLYLNYTIAFGERRNVSTDLVANRGPGQPPNELLATVAQSPPIGVGTGWRVSAATTGDYDASWQLNRDAFDLQLEGARDLGLDGQRGLLRGALTWLDGDLHAIRSVRGSFAVVDVAGVADIPVYVENQPIARTDAAGRAVLYNLRSYEPNRISIMPDDLPLDTSIAADRMVISPPYRSGVVARFPVERVRGGTFRLITDTGAPVPAGAVVRFNGGTFHVALDGLTYVDTLDHGTEGEALWGDHRCRFRVAPPPANDPLPDMGTIACQDASLATQSRGR